ncbi:MAG: nucleotidyl transferase AbiEii/AbiGii toxin family protein, partial [Acidobacteriota bacterium]
MKTLSELNAVAGASDFRPEVLEKVHHLLGILSRLEENELSHGQWVLKGGTAINLFHLDVPRLSVDIDLNFVGVEDLHALDEARRIFERALQASCAREGCSVRRAPIEHAGGKFRLRYASLLGGEQNLEVDVSYVARVPLFGIERRACSLVQLASDSAVPLLTLSELAAGKFVALVTRGAARDFFDASSLIELNPGMLTSTEFRVAFVVQIAASRTDLRNVNAPRALRPNELDSQLLPLLRVRSHQLPVSASELAERLDACVRPAVQELVGWSDGERCFLDRLIDEGEIEPEHL